jgi:hypothetical protein
MEVARMVRPGGSDLRRDIWGVRDNETKDGESVCIQCVNRKNLWLANCYFAHDSSGFPALRRFCDAQSGRAKPRDENVTMLHRVENR